MSLRTRGILRVLKFMQEPLKATLSVWRSDQCLFYSLLHILLRLLYLVPINKTLPPNYIISNTHFGVNIF